MVKQQEVNKSYEINYRIFLIEFENSTKKFMFTGGEKEVIEEFIKIKKAYKMPYGGRILELDTDRGFKVKVIKTFR